MATPVCSQCAAKLREIDFNGKWLQGCIACKIKSGVIANLKDWSDKWQVPQRNDSKARYWSDPINKAAVPNTTTGKSKRD